MAKNALALVWLAASAMTANAVADPDRHGKSIQQCGEELRASKAALAAAGESASAFIHDCWWHTKLGQKTPIAGKQPKSDDAGARLSKAEAAAAKAQAEAAAAKEEAARARQDAAEAHKAIAVQAASGPKDAVTPTRVAKPTAPVASRRRPAAEPSRLRVARAERPHRLAARRRVAPPTVSPPLRLVVVRAPRAEPAPRMAAARKRRLAIVRPRPDGAAAPLVDMVPVTIAGVPRPIRWPVFPQFVPAFKDAVNHPIVPGFTSTP